MTPFQLNSLRDLSALAPDAIIDVRSPAEFSEDHVPGAINLPVLNDRERARVGTLYKQDSAFAARKLGGALVAQNTAQHLQSALAAKTGSWQPLVYCWRGGQRSAAFATILDQVGWRVHLLKGGYQSYRRKIVQSLYDNAIPHRIVLIEGGTGTAKTALLHHLEAAGAQTIDLEGLAGHRGSLFGGLVTDQPSQKMFETHLSMRLLSMNPQNVTFVEAESSKIGELLVPPAVWAAMRDAPRVHIDAPLAARGDFLAQNYADLTEDSGRLLQLLEQLRPYHASVQIETWQAQAKAGDWKGLAQGLIAEHYDPRYTKSAERRAPPEHHIALKDLTDSTLSRTATELAQRFI